MSSVIDESPEICEGVSVVAHQLELNARARDHRAFMATIVGTLMVPPLFMVVDGDGHPVWQSVSTGIERSQALAVNFLVIEGHGWDALASRGYEVTRAMALPLAETAEGGLTPPVVDLIDLLERAAAAVDELSPDSEAGFAGKKLAAEIYEVLLRTSFVLSGFKDLHSDSEDEEDA